MATDVIVSEKIYENSVEEYDSMVTDVTNMWDWDHLTTFTTGTKFCVTSRGTQGLAIYKGNSGQTWAAPCQMYNNAYMNFAGPDVSTTSNYVKVRVRYERVQDKALIISAWRYTASSTADLLATLCDKYIITETVNSITSEKEMAIIYISSRSTQTSNKIRLLTSEIDTALSVGEMTMPRVNANKNAKSTILIPLYMPATACVTTNVFQSVCQDRPAWDFGYVTIKDRHYLMSGSIFVPID
jgi:hypothetical protein